MEELGLRAFLKDQSWTYVGVNLGLKFFFLVATTAFYAVGRALKITLARRPPPLSFNPVKDPTMV